MARGRGTNGYDSGTYYGNGKAKGDDDGITTRSNDDDNGRENVDGDTNVNEDVKDNQRTRHGMGSVEDVRCGKASNGREECPRGSILLLLLSLLTLLLL